MAQKSICETLNAVGSMEVLYINATANGVNYGYNANCPEKFQVIDVWCVNKGGALGAATITLASGTGNISDAMDVNIGDKTLARCTTLDDAYWTLVPGATLSATSSTGTSDADVFVLLMRVA